MMLWCNIGFMDINKMSLYLYGLLREHVKINKINKFIFLPEYLLVCLGPSLFDCLTLICYC